MLPKEISVLYLTLNPNRQSTIVPTEGWFKHLSGKSLRPVLVSTELGAFDAWCRSQQIASYQLDLSAPDKKHPIRFFMQLIKLARIVIRHKIQLIHCNEHGVFSIAKYIAKIFRLPIFVSIHFRMSRAFCEWAFSGIGSSATILFTSQATLEACYDSMAGLGDPKKWIVLKNGIDLNFYLKNVDLGISFRQEHHLVGYKLFGVACALRERKQLEHLFDAAHKLDANNFKVVVAGGSIESETEYGLELQKLAKAKLGDKVVFLGQLDDLRGFYNCLDFYVNTSKEEACSLSILEALACGCPVIGYPSCDTVSEQILPSAGEIVEQDNIDALSSTIFKWLESPHLIESAQLAARERVIADYNSKTQSERLLLEYQKAVYVDTSESGQSELCEKK